jgi:Arc/MetJ-type ribon-helix-helix transcriptional regulator
MATRQLTLTLPEDTVRLIEDQVATGRFTDASDVVQSSVEKLSMDKDWEEYEADPDEWLRQHALPALDALEADPSSGLSLEQVLASLEEDRQRGEDKFRKAS